MNTELAQFFISIAGVIIMLLLGAIVYFLKKWIDSTYSLTQAVNDLKTAMALMQVNQGNSEKGCILAHKTIEIRLNEHAKRLNEHGEAIAEIRGNKKITKRNSHPSSEN